MNSQNCLAGKILLKKLFQQSQQHSQYHFACKTYHLRQKLRNKYLCLQTLYNYYPNEILSNQGALQKNYTQQAKQNDQNNYDLLQTFPEVKINTSRINTPTPHYPHQIQVKGTIRATDDKLYLFFVGSLKYIFTNILKMDLKNINAKQPFFIYIKTKSLEEQLEGIEDVYEIIYPKISTKI